jgi:hypothetical protein
VGGGTADFAAELDETQRSLRDTRKAVRKLTGTVGDLTERGGGAR